MAELKPRKLEMKLLMKERVGADRAGKNRDRRRLWGTSADFFARRPVAQGSDHYDSRREAERGRFRRNNRSDDEGGMVGRFVGPRYSIGDSSNGGTPCGSPLVPESRRGRPAENALAARIHCGENSVGMQVEQMIAITDYLTVQHEIDASRIGVWGLGQGGMTALYAAAIDERLADATVQDHFRQREESWRELVGSSLV